MANSTLSYYFQVVGSDPDTAPDFVGQLRVRSKSEGADISILAAVGTDNVGDWIVVALMPLNGEGDPNGSVMSRHSPNGIDLYIQTDTTPRKIWTSIQPATDNNWILAGGDSLGGGGGGSTTANFQIFGTDAHQGNIPGSGGFAIFKNFGLAALNGANSGFREVAYMEDGVHYDSTATTNIDISAHLIGDGIYSIIPFSYASSGRSYSVGASSVISSNPSSSVKTVEFSSGWAATDDNEDETSLFYSAVEIRKPGATAVSLGFA